MSLINCLWERAYDLILRYDLALTKNQKITCPKRLSFSSHWSKHRVLHDYWTDANKCSCCGGLHPSEALRQMRKGIEIIPTEKSYKILLGLNQTPVYFFHFDLKHQEQFKGLFAEHKLRFAYSSVMFQPPLFMKELRLNGKS